MVDVKSAYRGNLKKHWRAPVARPGSINVGVIEPNYGMERVTYALRHRAYTHTIAQGLRFRAFRRRSNYFDMTPVVLARGYDLIHAWNSTPRNGRFVSSVEMEFPRLFGDVSPAQRAYALDRVASPDCRGIWTLSEAAMRLATRSFDRIGRPELAAKLDIFRGSITERAVAPSFNQPRTPGAPLKILFVASNGLLKGLYPLVAAARDVVRGGGNLHLTIVGSFSSRSHAVPGIDFERGEIAEDAQKLPWITIHRSLPNDQVRALMDTHDVLAHLTIDESLGWVPIEAAMSGLPTIATNAFALPEFVLDGKTGWIVPIQLNEDRRWHYTGLGGTEGRDAFIATEDAMKASLIRILSDIQQDPQTIAEYGQAAYGLALKRYHPDVAAEHLAALYTEALN